MINYKLIEEKYLESEQADAKVFEHIKTKAKVFVLKNNDDNKVFAISFRTPPKDSSGECHIIEHCVLNGSKKYRTKEPFMDMVKGSLQTFLNAMTGADRTYYPIGSRNTKDFENLMDLYLDAVFNPRMKELDYIFKQEGWRYHINENGKLEYRGVVYNEMKGALSSAEDQIEEDIAWNLFPDSPYSLNSGGDPYEIPKLSYDALINYYNEFYHPSNSYIFLYGDLDYEKYLNYIDENYLSSYDYRYVASLPVYQKAFDKVREKEVFYNTLNQSEEKGYISYSAIVGKNTDPLDRILGNLLNSVLINSESSPLKQKLMELDIMEDIINMSSSNLEISFSLLAKNIDKKNREIFLKTVEDTLTDIVKNGINKDIIKSSLNDLNFYIKEKGAYPTKGIIYLINALNTWIYDKSPIEGIDFTESLKYVQENIDKGIFEKFIEERLLNNSHKAILIHSPKYGLNQEKDKTIDKNLQNLLSSMTAEEKNKLREENAAIEAFQNRENTREEKATIPMLKLEDINKHIKPVNREIVKTENYTILKHRLATSGIDYIKFIFSAEHLDKEEILYMSLLGQFLGMLDSENYSFGDLENKIYMETGGIHFTPNIYMHYPSKQVKTAFFISTKIFSENVEKAFEVIEEVIFRSSFENKKRIKDLCQFLASRLEMGLYDNGHVLMMNRALSNHMKYYKINELINGIDFYLFVKSLNKIESEQIISKLKEVYKKLFTKKNLIINLTSDFSNESKLDFQIAKLVEKFENKDYENFNFTFEPKQVKEGFLSSADVQYVSLANKIENYDSKASILNNLASTGFLYNEIRAKGGAYGAGINISRLKSLAAYSYRDPNLKKTIENYRRLPQYLKELNIETSDLTPIIIGALGKFDPPMTERGKGDFDLNMYLSGRSYEELDDAIENALNFNIEDAKNFAPVIEEAFVNGSLAVLGNKSTLIDNKDLFDKLIEL